MVENHLVLFFFLIWKVICLYNKFLFIYIKILFDIFNNITSFVFFWWPWINFFDDVWFLQFLILYTFFVFYNSKNVYYSLLYLFFIIFYLGLAISIVQAELFTGFLWTTEFTVIMIALVLFFYLNVEGNLLKLNLKNSNFLFLYLIYFFTFVFSVFYFSNNTIFYQQNLDWLFFSYIFDDWYEAFNNSLMNDFITLTLAYYSINSFEYILVGYLLLLGSVLCVVLNKIQKNVKIDGNSNFLNFFNFFSSFLNFSFLRKQTLNDQSFYQPNLRLFKKKKW